MGFVAEEYRAAPLSDEKARKCCLKVSCCTLGRRKVYGFRCRRVPFILTSFCLAPTGNKNGRECRLNASCRTLGRRRSAEVSLKRAALHPRATKRRGIVAQACRAAPPGDGDEKYGFRCRRVPFILTSFCPAPFGNENGRRCCPSVSYCTLGRRKGATVLPKRVVPHSWATKMG